MKVVQIVGARPQFIKLAPVSAALAAGGHHEAILHTGQHFDDEMSRVFFDELGIPAPKANLDVHSLSHGAMTGRMMEAIEAELLADRPDKVIVYGDTDSTLAGSLAAVKIGIPVAHIEAGLRSFNRAMPEEINRVACDHISDLLLVPTDTGMKHLASEGLASRAHLVGDVMFDAIVMFGERGRASGILERLGLSEGGFMLATLHRPASTDDPVVLAGLIGALSEIAETQMPVILPRHPRTRAALERHGISAGAIQVVPPVSYLEMVGLLHGCRAVATDSGGLQKEAYFAAKPCLTLRTETEWMETVECGANVICGLDPELALTHARRLDRIAAQGAFGESFYGSGDAAARIVALLESDGSVPDPTGR